MMEMNINRKSRIALLSVASNTTLIIFKIVAGVMSGSVSIISEAIHSTMDLAAAVIAYFSVKVSSKPADKDHPYGHGKVENVSGVIEGLLIFVAAFLIIKEAITKIFHPLDQAELHVLVSTALIGSGVMLISAIVNFYVSRQLYKVAKEEESVALEADALHLKTDIYTSLGVAFGLIILKLTGIAILDPIVAILVAFLIVKEAWHLCKHAFSPLLDASLTEDEETKIKEIIEKYLGKLIDYHKLRTRRCGNTKIIDFHMLVDGSISVEEAHALSEDLENDIESELKNTILNIHIEPMHKDVEA